MDGAMFLKEDDMDKLKDALARNIYDEPEDATAKVDLLLSYVQSSIKSLDAQSIERLKLGLVSFPKPRIGE